jgi:excisionase family DNA binding protein
MRTHYDDSTGVPSTASATSPVIGGDASCPRPGTAPLADPAASPADPEPATGVTPGELTARGHVLHKGREGEADLARRPLAVHEAARVLGCSVRTARRWLQSGRLTGQKLGRDWVVWGLPPSSPGDVPAAERPTRALVRSRLRAVGARLIAVGNAVVAPTPRPGTVFLAWRAPRSLGVGFAIGRVHPTRGWAPIAVGLEYPFWLEGRPHWRPVLPLLRRYEQLRLWCAPALLRVPGVSAVVLGELTVLEAALAAVSLPQTRPDTTAAPEPEARDALSHEGDTSDEQAR